MPAEQGDRPLRLIFERQWMHAAGLIILLGGCYLAGRLQAVQLGAVWGLKSIDWYWIAIFTAVLHQVYVWLCWRIELHGKGLTTLLGPGAFPPLLSASQSSALSA